MPNRIPKLLSSVMGKRKAPQSWAEELADSENQTPRDFDPEEIGETFEEDESDPGSSNQDRYDGREHYETVGKSRLRKSSLEPLGPQYRGSRIGRDDLIDGESESGSSEIESYDEDLEDRSLVDAHENTAETSRTGNGTEVEESDGDVALENAHRKRLKRSQLGRIEASGGPDRKIVVETEGIDIFRTSGDDWQGDDDEDKMSIGGDLVEANNRVDKEEEETSADDPATLMEQADDSSEEGYSENETGSSISDSSVPANLDERATLRQMMAESQKTVVTKIREASKVDVAKGEAIAHQRTSFDALLNARIHLQKGIIAMNSLSSPDARTLKDDTVATVLANAEAAALKLWNGLEELRQAIQPTTTPPHKKRLPSPPTHSTSTAALWDRMQHHEAQSMPNRRATLTKWSSRLQPPAVNPSRSTLSGNPTSIPLTTILDQHLAGPNRARWLARIQVPRSCAPVQAAAHIPSDPGIYDDADFYATLLRELVERRMTDLSGTNTGTHPLHHNANSTAAIFPPSRDRKPRGQVDTRASKGRKMRFTVHEKLQNFMAPEDRGSWGQRQATELFAGLLGRRVRLGEEEGEGEEGRDEANGDMGAPLSEEALVMFGRP